MIKHDNNFDVLRLFAAWLVLFSHSYPLSGQPFADPFSRYVGLDTAGGVGVAIFFLLSGYLVTQSWQRSSSVTSFVWKRVRRIYPALVVCVLISVLLVGPILSTLAPAVYATHPQSISYLLTATGWDIQYVVPGVFWDNTYRHTFNGSLWSLPYELACYVALLVVGLLPLALRWKVSAVAVTLACMLLVRPLSPPASPLEVMFGLDGYTVKLGLFFAVGSMYLCWSPRLKPLWWVGAIGALVAWALPDSALSRLLWMLSLSTLVLAIALGMSWLPKLPAAMGDWSYGLYLYAFPVQQILAHYRVDKLLGFAGFTALSTLLAVCCAALSWFIVERPASQINWPFKGLQKTTATPVSAPAAHE
ncbi:MAG: acyltransferase [Rhizobacter sp.]|nr:acyltransferase [Burkholderiales bacterium]